MKNAKNTPNPDGQKTADKKAKTEMDKASDTDKTADKNTDRTTTKTGTSGDKVDGQKAITKAVTVALTKVSQKTLEKPSSQDGLKKWATKQALDETKTVPTDEESETGNPHDRTFPRSGKLARTPPGSQTPMRNVQSESSGVVGGSMVRGTGKQRTNSALLLLGDENEAGTGSEPEEDDVFVGGDATTREELAAMAMHGVRLKLDEILADPNAKFTKLAGQKIAALFSEVGKLVMQLGCDNSFLRGRLAERVEANRPPPMTFANVVSRQGEPRRKIEAGASAVPETNKARPRDRDFSVIVASKAEKGRSVEEVRKTLLEAIDPVASNIRIKNVRKTRDGRVVIQAHSKADVDKLVTNQAIREKGLTAALPAARKPRIILYDVPRGLEVDGVRQAIARQNPELLQGVEERTYSEEVVFRFKLGKGDVETVNWVVEVTPGMRDRFKKASRIYVGWRSCRVADFTSLTRCYRCLDLGHVAKYCKATKDTCSHCGLDGHRQDKCPNATGPKVCAVCKRRGRPASHAVSDGGCPSYKIARDRYAGTIDNG